MSIYFINIFVYLLCAKSGDTVGFKPSSGSILTEFTDPWGDRLQQELKSSVMCFGSTWELWENVSWASYLESRKEFSEEVWWKLRCNG